MTPWVIRWFGPLVVAASLLCFVGTAQAQASGGDNRGVNRGVNRDDTRGDVVLTIGAVGFDRPASVFHAVEHDVYLVANVAGGPSEVAGETWETDGDGFISRLSPDGPVLDLRWLDGADPAFDLHAPRGMGIFAGRLFVADIDTVRIFDVRTGGHLADVRIIGARFLAGLMVGLDGSVYVAESAPGSASASEGVRTVYRIGRGLGVTRPSTIPEHVATGLDAPLDTGIDATRNRLLISSASRNQVVVVQLLGR